MTAPSTDRGTSLPGHNDWRRHAHCLDEDPELWFALAGSADELSALLICQRSCPVRQSCLDDALGMPAKDDWGIRGGTTRDERAHLRAERRGRPSGTEQPCGTTSAARAHRRAHEPVCAPCRAAERVEAATRRRTGVAA